MPAKKTRRQVPDIQGDFRAHVEASTKAEAFATQAVAFRDAGKDRQADAAEREAKRWLAKAIAIEKLAQAQGPFAATRK